MRRGPKPAKSKEAKPPVPRKSPKDDGAEVRDLEKRLAEALEREAGALTREAEALGKLQTRDRDLTEALEQQTATSEILRVISQSPNDAQPVFDAIVASAVRLCGGLWGTLYRRYGDTVDSVASCNVPPEVRDLLRNGFPRPLRTGTSPHFHRALVEGAVTTIPHVETDPHLSPRVRAFCRHYELRSVVMVPLRGPHEILGVLVVGHSQVEAFSDRHMSLLQTFADQAVIAIENVRLFNELEEKNRALTAAHAQVSEALERQTATSEILRVISSAHTDPQPVFDTIVRSAVQLCGGLFCSLFQFDGELVHHVAHHNFTSEALEEMHRIFPARPTRALLPGRAILERTVIQIPDVLELDPGLPLQAVARTLRARSGLWVPLLREGAPLGVISVARAEPGPFSDNEIALLTTFADQAVIAIENVRLFTELQERNRDLTATGEILRVIASSPTDIQPVLDAVTESVARLCQSREVAIFRRDGDRLRLVANFGSIASGPVGEFTVSLTRGTVTGRCVVDGRSVHVADVQAEPDEFPEGSKNARRFGHRTFLAVPLMREGIAIGAIGLRRAEARLFTENQVALLQAFASQAVIAIENVRLFTELQASNRELTTALDTQTATSDILRVISRSQTDVQPVFDAIVHSAVRLLQGAAGALMRVAGDQIVLAAQTTTGDAGDVAQKMLFPIPLSQRGSVTGATIRARAPINIVDTQTDPRLSDEGRAVADARGVRSRVLVPLLRHDEAIGVIAVSRRDAGGFTDDEVALLQTFADQAVIAIENARLFSELQARTHELTRSVDQLTALGDVGRAVSSSLDLDTVLTTIVGRAVDLSGSDGGTIFEYDDAAEEFTARAMLNPDEGQGAAVRATRLHRGEGAVGQMAVTRQPFQIPDITAAGAYDSRIRGAMIASGTRSVLAMPLLHEDRLVGGLVVTRRVAGEFRTEVVELLRTFATQSALAIQNARLFRQLEIKSRELEVASQHKSEFLANMSHELRTPLNAIIGFSEVLTDRMFGELNEKQEEYLKDIYASGTHLLSLINDILDLSKIEAGRMELELTEFDLPTAIENALMLIRERAGRRSITLHTDIDNRLGQVQADERKVRQVVLNLLSNAIKFTPEGGRVDVSAVPKDVLVEVSVSDTGIGIAPEDQEKVFEEFRQVGTAAKKVEGTGLGLTLCRKFVELHGGRIWVRSELGAGSTFTFTMPVRQGE